MYLQTTLKGVYLNQDKENEIHGGNKMTTKEKYQKLNELKRQALEALDNFDYDLYRELDKQIVKLNNELSYGRWKEVTVWNEELEKVVTEES